MPCACCISFSSGIDRRKGERPLTSGCRALTIWSCGSPTSSRHSSVELGSRNRVVEPAKKVDVEMGVEYRGRLFEKTGLAKTADGSDDNLINVEVVEGKVSFTNVDSTPEPLKDVLPASYAPADEEHPPGANDEDDDSDEEGVESNSGANDIITTLLIDDDIAEGEEPFLIETATRYVLVSSAPVAFTAALVKWLIALW